MGCNGRQTQPLSSDAPCGYTSVRPAAVWICLYSKFSISAIAIPVKQERRTSAVSNLLCRSSLHCHEFHYIALLQKRIFFSSFYLALSSGLQRIILLLTARNISRLSHRDWLLTVDAFSPAFLRKKRYSSNKLSVMVAIAMSCTPLLSINRRFLSEVKVQISPSALAFQRFLDGLQFRLAHCKERVGLVAMLQLFLISSTTPSSSVCPDRFFSINS